MLFELAGKIMIDDKPASKAMDKIEKRSGGLGKALGKLGKATAAAGVAMGAALGAVGVKAIQAASNAEEMRGKFTVVFGDLEDGVRDWAKTQANAMGRSQIALEGYLSETQNMLVGMGSTRKEGAKLSKQIVELGVDLASFNNLAEDHALENLQSAISGNHNASKSLGAVLNENTLAMAMERMQIQGKFQDLDEATKMQVRYNAILMQSEDAVGDAERTSGSFANQMRRLQGSIADTMAELGEGLLPTATKFVSFITAKMPDIQEFLVGAFEKIAVVSEKLWVMFETYGIPTLNYLSNVFMNVLLPAMISFWSWLEPKLPALKQAFFDTFNFINNIIDGFVETIRYVMNWMGQWESDNKVKILLMRVMFARLFESIREFISAFVDWATDFWEKYGEDIIAVSTEIFNRIWSIVKIAFDQIMDIFRTSIRILTEIFNVFTALFRGDWEGFWEGIKNILSEVLGLLIRSTQKMLDVLFNVFGTNFEAVKDKVLSIVDSMVGAIQRAIDRIMSIVDGVMGAINRARDMAGNIGGKIKGGFSSAVSGVKNFIPGLAEGGRVTRGGATLVGERGIEILDLPKGSKVTPLDKAGGSVNNNFNIDNLVVRNDNDIKLIARELFNLQKATQRGVGIA